MQITLDFFCQIVICGSTQSKFTNFLPFSGAFIAETMLAVLVNEDVSHLVFEANLCDRFYQNKPIKPFMFFDITSVLVHYILALDTMDDLGKKLKIDACSLHMN